MSELPRFSATERLIVELLAAQEEMFGLQMVELSGGRLKRGTVYVTLGRMQEKGYLRVAPGAAARRRDRLPRRLYRHRPRDARARGVESRGIALHQRRQSAGGVMAITTSRARVRIAVV